MKKLNYSALAGIVLFFSGCAASPVGVDPVNAIAGLPPKFNYIADSLRVIAIFINKKEKTMSTLYGNSTALTTAITTKRQLVTGLTYTLVTWNQQSNPYWFGNRIPGHVRSIEKIKIEKDSGNSPLLKYQIYNGKKLMLNEDTSHQQERIAYILSLKPSILP